MTAPRRRWSFGLRALFALVTLAGVAALQVVRYWDSIRPIEWGAFSRQAVQQENALGHDVLVSFVAAWIFTRNYSTSGSTRRPSTGFYDRNGSLP